jgi:hypothetical protein
LSVIVWPATVPAIVGGLSRAVATTVVVASLADASAVSVMK